MAAIRKLRCGAVTVGEWQLRADQVEPDHAANARQPPISSVSMDSKRSLAQDRLDPRRRGASDTSGKGLGPDARPCIPPQRSSHPSAWLRSQDKTDQQASAARRSPGGGRHCGPTRRPLQGCRAPRRIGTDLRMRAAPPQAAARQAQPAPRGDPRGPPGPEVPQQADPLSTPDARDARAPPAP